MSGFSAAQADMTRGQEPLLAQRLDALAKALRIDLTGISGYRTPSHSIAVGGTANDPHTKGQAVDVGGPIQAIPETTLNRFGLTRPMTSWASPDGTVHDERNHIQLASAGATAMNKAKGGVQLLPPGQAQIVPDPGGNTTIPFGNTADKAANAAKNAVLGVFNDIWKSITSRAEYAGLFVLIVLAGVALAVLGLTRAAGRRQPQETPV